MQPSRPLSPAERCIRTVWANRAWFAALIAIAIGVAAAVTSAQPTLYRSQALLSVRAPGERVADQDAQVSEARPVLLRARNHLEELRGGVELRCCRGAVHHRPRTGCERRVLAWCVDAIGHSALE